MAIRPEFRWWVLTLAVVAVLLLISALALDRPDVVWEAGKAFCPHCRAAVQPFSRRCAACREQHDWTGAPDEQSPLSPWSLSALEDDHVRARRETLGRDAAIARVARALSLPPEAATAYVDHLGRGLCGWCGGTGLDLSLGAKTEKACPACQGRRTCTACGGDRRIRVGDEAAHLAFLDYQARLADVVPHLPEAVQREEVRRLGELFLSRHRGTEEATRVFFWPLWTAEGESPTVVKACRGRLDVVLAALEGD